MISDDFLVETSQRIKPSTGIYVRAILTLQILNALQEFKFHIVKNSKVSS